MDAEDFSHRYDGIQHEFEYPCSAFPLRLSSLCGADLVPVYVRTSARYKEACRTDILCSMLTIMTLTLISVTPRSVLTC
jgi:hypothetical protein